MNSISVNNNEIRMKKINDSTKLNLEDQQVRNNNKNDNILTIKRFPGV